MKEPLYPHQAEGVARLLQMGSQAFFHDPGLGKTRTCLEAYMGLREASSGLRMLVVCPKSLIRFAWKPDIEKYTPYTFSGLQDIKYGQQPDIVAVNYEKLIRKQYAGYVRELISGGDWMIVVDESSRMKNFKSLSTRTVLGLMDRFRYRVVDSGTPCPNGLHELWGQLRFVAPSLVPRSFYQFRNTWFHLEKPDEGWKTGNLR